MKHMEIIKTTSNRYDQKNYAWVCARMGLEKLLLVSVTCHHFIQVNTDKISKEPRVGLGGNMWMWEWFTGEADLLREWF